MKARIIIVASYETFIELAEMIKYSLNEINLRTRGVPFDKIVIQDDSKVIVNDPYDLNFIIKAFRPYGPGRLAGGPKILFQTEECSTCQSGDSDGGARYQEFPQQRAFGLW